MFAFVVFDLVFQY